MIRRERITITVKSGLLAALDRMIDGTEIRNRSHAFEYLLTKHFFPQKTKVLILAGGEGILLKELNYQIPKSLVPIQGKPLLEYSLKRFARDNFKEVLIAGGKGTLELKKCFGEGDNLGIKIEYLKDKDQGTALALGLAKKKLEGRTFFLTNGDILTKLNYLKLLEFHESHKGVATMALTYVDDIDQWGVAAMEGNKIVAFDEKPKKRTHKSRLANAGVYIFDADIFKYLTPKMKSLEKDLLPELVSKGELYGYPFNEKWYDIGKPGIYAKVAERWEE